MPTVPPCCRPLRAAVKALRFALAHPAAAPSLQGLPATGHHLQATASMLAKRRAKAGAGVAAQSEAQGSRERVQDIDALLAAMKRRLRAVQAAMARELRQAQEQQASTAPEAGEAPVPAEAAAAPPQVNAGVPGGFSALLSATTGASAEAARLAAGAPASSVPARAAAGRPSSRARSGKEQQGSVARQLHAFADTLRERQ